MQLSEACGTGHVIGFEPMPPDSVHAVTLNCHPDTPTAAVRGIAARVGREPGDRLAVTYVLEGDFDRLRVPSPRAPGFGSRLWQHTCCEVFIACKGVPAYYEFNFSPSGEWAAYAFDGYRSPRVGETRSGELDPQVVVRGAANKLELDALIRLDRLPEFLGMPLALGLSAVVEDSAGALSYWALRHPAGKPDFHHSEAFALELGEAGR
ncbi:MAG TPA: DOMON-like domain-containing protein [Burkholderiales bacterium]|nr:DOMON-like domain-containing protein [Burkholderiales bacterium]